MWERPLQRRPAAASPAPPAVVPSRAAFVAVPRTGRARVMPHRLDAISAVPAGAPVQRFIVNYENSRTHRSFSIQSAGTTISASQIAGDDTDKHSGHLQYTVRGQHFELHSIQSDPEEGSGIGSILVYFMAKTAESMGHAAIEIPMSAATAVGFYERLGFVPADELEALRLELTLVQDDDQHAAYAEQYAVLRARITYEKDVANRRAGRRWDTLGEHERTGLVAAQRDAFGLLSKAQRIEITSQMLHGKAVQSRGGMIGKSATVIDRAWATASRDWRFIPFTDFIREGYL
jgi:GNAT superfamily N-acetyltransferase